MFSLTRRDAHHMHIAFTQPQLSQLSRTLLIPAQLPGSSTIRMVRPIECYFESSNKADFHSKLFIFVDFGPKANNFLAACGVRHAPTIDEVVKILVAGPKKFYDLVGGPER